MVMHFRSSSGYVTDLAVSCREFEFGHDVRLSTLAADEVTVAPLQPIRPGIRR